MHLKPFRGEIGLGRGVRPPRIPGMGVANLKPPGRRAILWPRRHFETIGNTATTDRTRSLQAGPSSRILEAFPTGACKSYREYSIPEIGAATALVTRPGIEYPTPPFPPEGTPACRISRRVVQDPERRSFHEASLSPRNWSACHCHSDRLLLQPVWQPLWLRLRLRRRLRPRRLPCPRGRRPRRRLLRPRRLQRLLRLLTADFSHRTTLSARLRFRDVRLQSLQISRRTVIAHAPRKLSTQVSVNASVR